MVSYLICYELFSESCFLCLFLKICREKNLGGNFFGKVAGLQHPNLMIGTPLQVIAMELIFWYMEIIFWGIFQYSNYMKSLLITDKFCAWVIFLNMADIFQHSYKKRRDVSSLNFLSPWFSYALYVYLTFIQYSNILLSSFFTTSCCCSIYTLEVKFWLCKYKWKTKYAHQKSIERKKHFTWMKKIHILLFLTE